MPDETDRKAFIFEELPAELRLQIYSHLNLGDALVLGSVCQSFRNDRPDDGVGREQRATYVYHAETFKRNREQHRLGCFTCLRVLDRNAFRESQRTGAFDLFGTMEFERICFDCEVTKGTIDKVWFWRTARIIQRGWNHPKGYMTEGWDRLGRLAWRFNARNP